MTWIAIGSAFWLGLLIAISPCPLATNIAAISFIGRQVGNRRAVEIETGTRGAENIKKLIPLNLDQIISFSTTDAVKHRTLRALKEGVVSVNNVHFINPTRWDINRLK